MNISIIDERVIGSSSYLNRLEYFSPTEDSVSDVPFSFTSQEEKGDTLLKLLKWEEEIHNELNFQKGYTQKKEEESSLKPPSFNEEIYFLNELQKDSDPVAQESDEKVDSLGDPLPRAVIYKLLNVDELHFSPYSSGRVLNSEIGEAEKRGVMEPERSDEVRISVDGNAHEDGAFLADSSSRPSKDSDSLPRKSLEYRDIWLKTLGILKNIQKELLANEDIVNEDRVNEGRVNEGRVNENRVNEYRVNEDIVNEGRVNDDKLLLLSMHSEGSVTANVAALSHQVYKDALCQLGEAWKDLEVEQNCVDSRDVEGTHRMLAKDIQGCKSLQESSTPTIESVPILEAYIKKEIIDSEGINVLGYEFLEFIGTLADDMKANLVQLIMEALWNENLRITNSLMYSGENEREDLRKRREILKNKVSVFFQSVKKDSSIINDNYVLYVYLFVEYSDVPGAVAVVPLIDYSHTHLSEGFSDYCIQNVLRSIEKILATDRTKLEPEDRKIIEQLELRYLSMEHLCDQSTVSIDILNRLLEDLGSEDPEKNICAELCGSFFDFCTHPDNAKVLNCLDASLIAKMQIMVGVLSNSNVSLGKAQNGNFIFSIGTILKLHYSVRDRYTVYMVYVASHLNRLVKKLYCSYVREKDKRQDFYLDSTEWKTLWKYIPKLVNHSKNKVEIGGKEYYFPNFSKLLSQLYTDYTKSKLIEECLFELEDLSISHRSICNGAEIEELEIELLMIRKWSEDLKDKLQSVVSSQKEFENKRKACAIASCALEKIKILQADQEFFMGLLHVSSEKEKKIKAEKKKNTTSLYLQSYALLAFLQENAVILNNFDKEIFIFSNKIIQLYPYSSEMSLASSLDSFLNNNRVHEILEQPFQMPRLEYDLLLFSLKKRATQFKDNNRRVIESRFTQDVCVIFSQMPRNTLLTLLRRLNVFNRFSTDFMLINRLNQYDLKSKHYALVQKASDNLCSDYAQDPLWDFFFQMKFWEMLEPNDPINSILLKFYWNKEVYNEDMYTMFEEFFIPPDAQSSQSKDTKTFTQANSSFSYFVSAERKYNFHRHFMFNNLLNDILGIELLQLKNRLEGAKTQSDSDEKLKAVFIELQSLFDQMMQGDTEGIDDYKDFLPNASDGAIGIPEKASKKYHLLFHDFLNIIQSNQNLLGRSFTTTLKLLESFFSRMGLEDMASLAYECYQKGIRVFKGVLFSYNAYLVSKKLNNMSLWLKVQKFYFRVGVRFIPTEESKFFRESIAREMMNDEDSLAYCYFASRICEARKEEGAIEDSLDLFESTTKLIINDMTGEDFGRKKWLERVQGVKKFLRWRKNYIKKMLLKEIYYRGKTHREIYYRRKTRRFMLLPVWGLLKNMQILLAMIFLWDFIRTICTEKNLEYGIIKKIISLPNKFFSLISDLVEKLLYLLRVN